MADQLTRAAQRAADSLAADVLSKTAVGYGRERPDVLDAVARALLDRASELRQARIDQTTDQAEER